MIDSDYLSSLEGTGILDAYEYVIRKLIVEDNMPTKGIYEKSALYILEYQKLHLERSLRVAGLRTFFDLSDIDARESKGKDRKRMREVIPSFPIDLRSKYLLDEDELKKIKEAKVFETNIDELMNKKIQLVSKNMLLNEYESTSPVYGNFAAFVKNENEKLKMHTFKSLTRFEPYQFQTLLEIQQAANEERDKTKNKPLSGESFRNGFSAKNSKNKYVSGNDRENRKGVNNSSSMPKKSLNINNKKRVSEVSDDLEEGEIKYDEKEEKASSSVDHISNSSKRTKKSRSTSKCVSMTMSENDSMSPSEYKKLQKYTHSLVKEIIAGSEQEIEELKKKEK